MTPDPLLSVQHKYLRELYEDLPADMEARLLARRTGRTFRFSAFGEDCVLGPEGISLAGEVVGGAEGVLIALYAFHASVEQARIEPIKSFRQIRGSAPYQGAFSARSQNSLVPFADQIHAKMKQVAERFAGTLNHGTKGDFSFTLYPLPKIALYYIFYLADEEFPASVTCLFGANAEVFMPVDGLADVGEYTARRIAHLVRSES